MYVEGWSVVSGARWSLGKALIHQSGRHLLLSFQKEVEELRETGNLDKMYDSNTNNARVRVDYGLSC